ncbi:MULTISPECIES: hypothetical protein [unclassified Microcoleus]
MMQRASETPKAKISKIWDCLVVRFVAVASLDICPIVKNTG